MYTSSSHIGYNTTTLVIGIVVGMTLLLVVVYCSRRQYGVYYELLSEDDRAKGDTQELVKLF